MATNKGLDTWESRARAILNSQYLRLANRYDQYIDYSVNERLLLGRICTDLYGRTKDLNVEQLNKNFNEKQMAVGETVCESIRKIYHDARYEKLFINTVHIVGKQLILISPTQFVTGIEHPFPLFSVNDDITANGAKYVDPFGRIYSSWHDWKQTNNYVFMVYAYPCFGYYSCSKIDCFEFDPTKEVNIEFGVSPVLRRFKLNINIEIKRSISPNHVECQRWDNYRISHDPLLSCMPQTYSLIEKSSTEGNAKLVKAAGDEGIVATDEECRQVTQRNTHKIQTLTTLIALEIDKLKDVASNKGRKEIGRKIIANIVSYVNSLDKSLRLPFIAEEIIAMAQDERLEQVAGIFDDDDEKKTAYWKFLADNKGDNIIDDQAKIIRFLKKLQDPQGLFKMLTRANGAKICDDSQLLEITSANNRKNTIDPNTVYFTTIDEEEEEEVEVDYQANGYQKLKDCLKVEPNDIEINGRYLFREENLNARQKKTINTVLADKIKYGNIIWLSIDVAKEMGYGDVDSVLCLMEIVYADVRKSAGIKVTIADAIAKLDIKQYISKIKDDLAEATEIASKARITFINPLNGLKHFRKHGHEFAKIAGDHIEAYLRRLPDKLIVDENVRQIDTFSNSGSRRLTYVTEEGYFAVIIDSPENHRIATLCNKSRKKPFEVQRKNLAEHHATAPKVPDFLSNLSERLTELIGNTGAPIDVVMENGDRVTLDDVVESFAEE